MTRRNFIKLLGLSGVAAMAPNLLAKEIRNNIVMGDSRIKIRQVKTPPLHFNCRCITVPLEPYKYRG